MGSIRNPRSFTGHGQGTMPGPDRPDAIPPDCPPDIAVSFLAKLYTASPRLREAAFRVEAPPQSPRAPEGAQE